MGLHTPYSVPRLWPGETCAVLASGPSMNRETCEAVAGPLPGDRGEQSRHPNP